jgi:hypothetical protein
MSYRLACRSIDRQPGEVRTHTALGMMAVTGIAAGVEEELVAFLDRLRIAGVGVLQRLVGQNGRSCHHRGHCGKHG